MQQGSVHIWRERKICFKHNQCATERQVSTSFNYSDEVKQSCAILHFKTLLTLGVPQSHTSPSSFRPFPHTGVPRITAGIFDRQESRPKRLKPSLRSCLEQLDHTEGGGLPDIEAMIQRPDGSLHTHPVPVHGEEGWSSDKYTIVAIVHKLE